MDTINYTEIAQEVKEKQKEQPLEHKEAVISVLQEKTRQQLPSYQPQPIQPIHIPQQVEIKPNQDTNLPEYATNAPAEAKTRTQKLIETTLEKGLHEGISDASHEDPFIIDMYHDALAEHIVEQLKEKGML